MNDGILFKYILVLPRSINDNPNSLVFAWILGNILKSTAIIATLVMIKTDALYKLILSLMIFFSNIFTDAEQSFSQFSLLFNLDNKLIPSSFIINFMATKLSIKMIK